MRVLMITVAAAGLLLTLSPSRARAEDAAAKEPGRAKAFKARLLERFDANKDGQLDDAEKAEARKAFEGMRRRGGTDGRRGRRPGARGHGGSKLAGAGMRKMLEKFDADKDGRLNEAERGEARAALEAAREKFRGAMLARYDTDRDGTIGEAERKTAKESLQQAAAEVHLEIKARFDQDGDGELSHFERRLARRALFLRGHRAWSGR